MRDLLILAAGFTVSAIVSDGFSRSRKLYAALGRVAIVHAIGLAAVMAVLVPAHGIRAVPILIFWLGALLAWFGVRSHIESSILLRMIHILRHSPLTPHDLALRYGAFYGKAQRIAELHRAGFLKRDPERATIALTRKGLLVARLALRLTM